MQIKVLDYFNLWVQTNFKTGVGTIGKTPIFYSLKNKSCESQSLKNIIKNIFSLQKAEKYALKKIIHFS